ncbi:uncharacterized protein N7482_005789 [Penicillium canariense]|uniref:Isopenicillin N synthase-like Fe(2+) 2OG dioxygenase domain-containing protein n=1 Tax=Penicillium canariense TaxID=189055 RepID=A0A9W9I586_9EURO|nr:uncharacterized protein N7482_005789 [Penicillium canariense]KAJ5167008.1 hypothetical protein N7482_005789 [Penicillium canariense]
MSTTDGLPLLDLTGNQDPSTISTLQKALLRYGAFRLWAPELKRAYSPDLLQNARAFFQLPLYVKGETRGYSPLDSELIRGDTPIPKESIYFLRKSDPQDNSPPSGLHDSVMALHDKWKPLKDDLFSMISNDVLDPSVPLTGTSSLDYESLGIHYYDPHTLGNERVYSNPAHMDGGTLTLLIRGSDAHDGLEFADLQSTDKLDSNGIGQEASFLRIPAHPDEVVVLAGTRLQRLFGKDKVRACVHRVRGPVSDKRDEQEARLSITIACALRVSPTP